MNRLRIAILGAPQSGKTRLVQDLSKVLDTTYAYEFFDNPDQLQPDGRGEVHWDLILLTGLDLAGMGTQHTLIDQALRGRLTQYALPYTTVYGSDATRSANALQAIRFHFRDPVALQGTSSQWRWPCEKCSDPECEHRLFSALLQKT